ncbi:hypothetical protein SLS58_007871 [Diplodia intermedia]|uniref:Uncharacterized protein n=1 Tax=Diplodia intermedia TaxID=856260 RepID=A0ABR3TJ44_9PEZI
MKENFQRIKRENQGKSHKDIMEIVGREYKETKIKQAKQVDVEDGQPRFLSTWVWSASELK